MRRYKSIIIAVCLIAVIVVGGAIAAYVRPLMMKHHHPSRLVPIAGGNFIRTATALTTSYVDTDFIRMDDFKSVALMFSIVKGSLTSFQYRVWQSADGVTWYQEATESIAAGIITDAEAYYTHTIAADVNYFKTIPFNATYMKLDVKGTGTVTGNTLSVKVLGRY